MFCDRCGSFTIARTTLDSDRGEFACSTCGRQFSRRVLPLFIVTGASGVGKTTIIELLQRRLTEYGVFDKDALWAQDWDTVYNNYFRIASALAQGGRLTVIVGTILPEFFAGLADRDLVGTIHYANLHCDDETRARRLLTRRTWGIPDEAFIRDHQVFARWLLDHAETDFDPPMPTFDTTTAPPEDVAEEVARWVRGGVPARVVYVEASRD
jgi:transposase-like protein